MQQIILGQIQRCFTFVIFKTEESSMEISTAPIIKNQRRKRKDPESRDFICKCGKKYLSYAAAYTHVKSKHQGRQDYFDNISRPERVKLKRGRPKQRKIYVMTPENEKLTIIQEAILQIFEMLTNACSEDYLPRIIIEGNQEFSVERYQENYEFLMKEHGIPTVSISLNNKEISEYLPGISEFFRVFTQHFIPQIAAKAIYTLNYILQKGTNIETIKSDKHLEVYFIGIGHELIKRPEILAIWDNNPQAIKIIMRALEKWLIIDQKQETEEQNYISF